MLSTFTSAIELSEKLRSNGNRIYQAMGWIGSIIALLSVLKGERPSELISEFFNMVGYDTVARLFGSEAPPFIERGSATVEQFFLIGIAAAVVVMISMPVYYELRDPVLPGEYSKYTLWVLGNPVSATFWLLLLAAVQQGPNSKLLKDPSGTFNALTLWATALVAATVLISLFMNRLRPAGVYRVSSWSLHRFPKHLAFAIIMAFIGIMFVPFRIPIMVALRAFSWEPHILKEARKKSILKRAETMPEPTGSIGNTRAPTGL